MCYYNQAVKFIMYYKINYNWPVGETVNSQAFHACIHGFESRTGHQIGVWFNGRASVSKTVDAGSIPATPAIQK